MLMLGLSGIFFLCGEVLKLLCPGAQSIEITWKKIQVYVFYIYAGYGDTPTAGSPLQVERVGLFRLEKASVRSQSSLSVPKSG